MPGNPASIVDDEVDLQNGPDNVVLLDPLNVVSDSVGYSDIGGSFSFPNVFLGEGTFVRSVAAPQTLSRLPDGQDDGDNAVDFKAGEPTPGAANLPSTL